MQLRRFVADTTPAALGAVRQALGDDAIILANRRAGQHVEIIATGVIDEAALSSATLMDAAVPASSISGTANDTAVEPNQILANANGAGASTQASAPSVKKAQFESIDPTDTTISQTDGALSLSAMSSSVRHAVDSGLTAFASGSRTDQMTANRHAVEVKPVPSAEGTVTIEELSRDLADMPSPTQPLDLRDRPAANGHDISASHAAAESASQSEALLDRFAQKTETIDRRLQRLEVNLWGEQDEVRTLHLKQLLHLGIGAELAVRLVERVTAGTTLELAMRQSLSLLKSTLPIGVDNSLRTAGVTVFSGPTGGGKTTALVKLATQQVTAAGNQSVIMVCADSRRIGAFESLQAYGRLLGVPVVQAHDAGELESLIAAFAHKHLVLVDHTLPSRSDAMAIPTLPVDGQGHRVLRHLFVLPATLQSATVDALIADHKSSTINHCVLTHLDQSARLGELFNVLIRHYLPIAYWSDNSQVQMPLQKADASVLVATAVAMGRRVRQTPDEQCLIDLLQPTRHSLGEVQFGVPA